MSRPHPATIIGFTAAVFFAVAAALAAHALTNNSPNTIPRALQGTWLVHATSHDSGENYEALERGEKMGTASAQTLTLKSGTVMHADLVAASTGKTLRSVLVFDSGSTMKIAQFPGGEEYMVHAQDANGQELARFLITVAP